MGLKHSTLETKENPELHYHGKAIESSVQLLLDNLCRMSAVLTLRSIQSPVQSSRAVTHARLFFTFSNRKRTLGEEKGYNTRKITLNLKDICYSLIEL